MKQLLFIIFTFFYITTQAQSNSYEQRVKTLLIDKISSYKSNDLIPYYSESDDKWGFFHRETKKIITTGIFNSDYFFTPDLRFAYSFEEKGDDGCYGKILGSNQGYRIEYIEPARTAPIGLYLLLGIIVNQ